MAEKMDTAVAVKYIEGAQAPFILAKGKNELARKLVTIAENNGVEITESANLADNLFNLEVGDFIPEEYYEIMAEILSFVYSLKVKK